MAVDIGYRLFDTAAMYGNEKIGETSSSSINREQLFITTKIQ